MIGIQHGAMPRRIAPLLVAGLALAVASGNASAATVNIYGNTNPITIPVSGATTPYPSTIAVSGLTGNVVTKVSVQLNGFTHGYPADVDVLLVGPGGERVMLMSDAGGGSANAVADDIYLTFSPTATAGVPQSAMLSTATLLPANYPNDEDSTDFSDPFPDPAPTVLDREPTDLTVFNGTNPNGSWKLYVNDDYLPLDGGDIDGGWTLFLTVPTVFTVTKTADTNDGVCDADCSLREAIAAATAASGNDDLIRFSALFDTPQTITLGGDRLFIDESMTIQGPGADLLSISGNGVSGVFGTQSGLITLSGLTVRDGYSSDGGGISTSATQLYLRNVAVTGNRAVFHGGGAHMIGGRYQFTGCTFSDNESGNRGSALRLFSESPAELKLINTTVSGNRSNASGAISVFSASSDAVVNLEIVNSTIANNSGISGGGINLRSSGNVNTIAKVSFRNSIVSNNSLPNITTEVAGQGSITITSLGFNLVDEDTGGYFNQFSDKVGVDPRLGPLTNNGGQTESHALMGGSPALDAGERSGYQRDQRGLPRSFDAPGVDTAAGGDGSDIGALEMQVIMVTGNGDPDVGSLHQAILDANANGTGHDDILFEADFFSTIPRVINLVGPLPPIATSLNIVGPGSKQVNVHRLTGGNYRIFEVMNEAGRQFSISGITLSNGSWPGSGGGIFSIPRTSLTEVEVFNNFSTSAFGGGAHLSHGTIKNSTFSLNSALTNGGALHVQGNMRIVNSTFHGNVGGQAPGIALVSEFGLTHTLELINSTISGNSGSSDGGLRVRTAGSVASIATAILRNTIVAGNTAPNLNAITSGGGPSTIDSRGYNLTSDASATYLDQATDKINTDPLLGPLQNNGGATGTQALLPGSPALDAGGRSSYLSDQRRLRRPVDQALIANAADGDGSDIGAVEMLPEIFFHDGFE